MYSSVAWTLQQSLFYKNLVDMFLPALGAKLLAPSGKHTRGSVDGRIHAVAPSIEQPRSQPRSLLPPPPDRVDGRFSERIFLHYYKSLDTESICILLKLLIGTSNQSISWQVLHTPCPEIWYGQLHMYFSGLKENLCSCCHLKSQALNSGHGVWST